MKSEMSNREKKLVYHYVVCNKSVNENYALFGGEISLCECEKC